MRKKSYGQILTLLLGLFVALGMALSAVQASDMTVKMAMSADVGAIGHHGGNGCGGDSKNSGAKITVCASTCALFAFAVLPEAASIVGAETTTPTLQQYQLSVGMAYSPELTPPRS